MKVERLTRLRGRPWVGVALFVMLGAVIAGCGQAASTSTQQKVPVVTDALTGQDPIFSDVVLAQQLGYFAAAKVQVNFYDAGVIGIDDAAAGRVDLAEGGTPAAFAPSVAGQQMSIVYGWMSGDPSDAVLVKANSPYHSLIGLSGQRVVVEGEGTSSYASAETLSKYIVAHGGKPLVVVPASSTGGMPADVISGSVQAGIAAEAIFSVGLASGQLRLLMSPSSPLAFSIFPKSVIGNSIFGLRSVVNRNSVGITRMIAALRKADQYIHTHSVGQIASVLATSPYLSPLGLSAITLSVKADKPFYALSLGYISGSAWNATLNALKPAGLSVSLSAPQVSYSAIVDMKLWNAASKVSVG